jgi:tetratricopeptide (TPR) repeat protein
VSSPPEEPLVVAAAGLQFSLNSLAHLLRPLFGLETRRRLTMSVLCRTADCRDDALSLHVVALAEQVVAADAVDLNAAGLGRAIDAAARHLLETFDPQPLATMYYRQGKLGEAKRLAARIVKDGRARSVWADNLLGLVAMQSGLWTEASDHLEAALKIDPDYLPALINLGKVQARLCDWEGAAVAYEQALAVDPNVPSANRVLELVKSFPMVKSAHFAALPETPISASMTAAGRSPAAAPVTLADLLAVSDFCSNVAKKPPPPDL